MSGGSELDRDGAAVCAGLRRALVESGLSQAGFARAMGTSSSRFSTYLSGRTVPAATLYLRTLRIAESLREAGEQSLTTPILTVQAVRAALAADDSVWALKMILQSRDHLRRVLDGGLRSNAAWEADPGSAGAEDWDRLLAALVGHEFEARQLPPPAWTVGETTGAGWWLFGSPFLTAEEVQAQTPPWLAGRGLFIAARDLVTA